jgi:hypothetical protein
VLADDRIVVTSAKEHGRALSRARLIGGGTDGNRQLTAVVGLVLIPLLLVIAVTILRIRQLMWVHLFVGLLLIGPVLAKMASTGYRFVRYYARDLTYRAAGPPELWLRLSAPVLVVMTVAVFVTGVVLLFVGPTSRGSLVEIHKVTFIVWAVFFGLHLLGHLLELPTSLRAVRIARGDLPGELPGEAGRWIAFVGALVAGLVLAIVLIPHYGAWTANGAFPHHHHHL